MKSIPLVMFLKYETLWKYFWRQTTLVGRPAAGVANMSACGVQSFRHKRVTCKEK